MKSQVVEWLVFIVRNYCFIEAENAPIGKLTSRPRIEVELLLHAVPLIANIARHRLSANSRFPL